MNKNSAMDEKQTWLVAETISKNEWCGADLEIRLDVWSNFHQSPDVLRTYLCKDGSGYIRGYYDGAGTFFVQRFHLRDEVWTEPQPSPS